MQGDDPPFLPVGTDVSAKYKGAFCEAKVKKVVRNIKCKVTLKAGGGIITVNDDVIKGTLRVGSTVEVKQDPKKDAVEAIITKIQDCSQYTVVFDDGDITTLRRSALCLKSGRHFNESETLDQLPLTHPEHFSTPVIAGRRGRRGRAQSEESEPETPPRGRRPGAGEGGEREPHVGRVVLVEAAGGAERRRGVQPAFPALVVAPTPQIKVKEDYLVRSFKDGRYYTVPKKEAREFRKGSAPLEWSGVEAALQYLNNGVLPPHWDRDSLFNHPNTRNTSDDSSDDEPREEKDHFVAQLYKFMDDRGTPLNRNPTIANRDIDLYRLFRVVQKLGGYNRVTNQNQWKNIADKMGFHPATTSITNLCKQAYKKFLHSFEDFYRKLGVTLVAHPRGARTPPAGRSLIRDRDKQLLTSSSASSTPTGTPSQRGKDSDKSETEKSEKSEKDEKLEKSKDTKSLRGSDGEDSADNQPLVPTAPKPEKPAEKEKEKEKEKDKEKEKEKEKDKEKEKEKSATPSTSEEKIINRPRPRSVSKTRTITPVKLERQVEEKRLPRRRQLSNKHESPSTSTSRASRRPHVSTDSDSSGRASRCGIMKKMPSRRSQSANSASSGNTIASNSSKRPRKRKTTEPSTSEPPTRIASNVKAQVGDKLKVYYGPTQSESKVTYEAKVIEISSAGMLRVHYTGWNTRYDEWIKPNRIAINVTQHEQKNKKNTSLTRRLRAKRTEESSARSDSDSDSDSEVDVKRPPKKIDEKSGIKTPTRLKDAAKSSDSSSSSKPRKRPIRTVSTPSSSVPPRKKLRPNVTSHPGRDYDLNEIRSELKGLQTVKQEPEETIIKQEPLEKEEPSTATLNPATAPPAEPTQSAEKKEEDVYEFKEPEPFELELHDEKKKRTHRIFDDISPSKYTSTLSKSLSEEISEDPLRPRPQRRSPSLSPFRDFGGSREPTSNQSPEEDTKDDPFSMDDDSFQDGSGPIFEGFTPAKNQETYSKKNKVSKLRELIDDSPESPADDEQSSDDEPEEIVMKDEEPNPHPEPPKESLKSETPETVNEEPKPIETESLKELPLPATSEPSEAPKDLDLTTIIEPPKTPPPKSKIDLKKLELSTTESKTSIIQLAIPLPAPKPVEISEDEEPHKEEVKPEENKLISIPLPCIDPPKILPEKKKMDVVSKMEPPSSPLIDTEEDKSEPDSPARIDVPEPPPGFLLQSEGPKIAEKLLKAINSAKRLSMSPPPVDNRSLTPKIDLLKITKPEGKVSPVTPEAKSVSPAGKPDVLKPLSKLEPNKSSPSPNAANSIFGEPSKMSDAKRDVADVKKIPTKPKDPTPPRLQSPLNILERRKSVADGLPLTTPGKNNKVLSDTIQKLSSQINQSAASITLPTFQAEERSDSSDSDDSDRRLIIDKLSVEEWALQSAPAHPMAPPRTGLHAGKSPGEWSAGETLLMLEDACKNERKHSASVVVAGSGRVGASGTAAPGTGAGEDDSNISLLLCSETIPGSPAPDAEPAPPRQRLHMPFASAPPHHHHKAEERRAEASREGPSVAGKAHSPAHAHAQGQGGGPAGGQGQGGGQGEPWRRRALLDNTPPTTPDSSPDRGATHRERRISAQDSPADRKEDDDESRPNDNSMDIEKPHVCGAGVRSRKASESSLLSAARGRRRRRDTDTDRGHTPAPPLKYNFYVELDPQWDCPTRINILQSRLADLRKAYHSVKAELAAIDRRRKKLRRKEREAVKAAKAACS